jgi:hypothetical protein
MLFGLLLTLGVAVLSVGLRTFHNSYAQKAGALGILAATFLGFYFRYNNWDVGFGRALGLAVSALAGNSHPDSCAATSERKTASTEKSAIVRHVPGA